MGNGKLEIGKWEIQQASVRRLADPARHCAMREENGVIVAQIF